MLLMIYVILGMAFFFVPEAPHGGPNPGTTGIEASAPAPEPSAPGLIGL
jgi:hypothetical protein